MSDQTSQPSTVGSGTVQPGVQPQPTKTVAERLREIGNLPKVSHAKATIVRRGRTVGESIGESMDIATAKLTNTKSELDYVRRHTRFTELIETCRPNRLLAEAVRGAEGALKLLPVVPIVPPSQGDKPVDWAAAYLALGAEAEKLTRAVDEAEQRTKAARLNVSTKGMMAKIAECNALLAKKCLPEDEMERRQATFRELEFQLVSGDFEVEKIREAIENSADILKSICEKYAKLRDEALLRHAKLSRQLAGTKDEQTRLTGAALLTAAENAARGYDHDTAKDKLDEAERLLGPPPKDLPTAKDVAVLVETLKIRVGKLVQLISKGAMGAPEKKIYDQAVQLQSRVESCDYMLAKAGDGTAAEISRIIDTGTAECLRLETAFRNVFDPVAGAEKYRKEFAERCKPVEQKATELYARSDAPKDYVGDFHGQIDALKLRLEDAMKSAASIADLHIDALDSALEQIAQEIAAAMQKPPVDANRIAFDGAATEFARKIRALDDATAKLMDSDSDLALRLGLLGAPAQLRREGEQLAKTPPPSDAMAAVAEKLNAVTARIQVKLDEIAKAPSDPTTDPEKLRSECEVIRLSCETRIGGVLELIKADNEKLLSSLPAEQRKGIAALGETMKKRLAVLASPAAEGASADRAVLADTKKALEAFVAEVDMLEKMGPGPKHVSGMKHFDDVTSLVDELLGVKGIGHSLFKPRKDVTEEWNTTLQQVKSAPYKRDPAIVFRELTAMGLEIAKARELAEKEHKAAEEMADAIEQIWDLITLPTDKLKVMIETWPEAFKAFGRELKDAAASIRTGDRPDGAVLEAVKAKYDKLTDPSGDVLRTNTEESAKQANAEYAKALNDLQQILEVDVRLLQEKAKAMSGDARKEMTAQLKSIVKATELAITTLKDNRNAKQAGVMRDSIEGRLRLIQDAPLGNTTRGRNELKAAETQWRSAVLALHQRLGAVPGTVESACEPTEAEALKAAAALPASVVKPLTDLLQEEAFAAIIARMANADEPGILDAREDALAEIRRIRRVMLSDPKFRLLAKPPFSGAQVSFRPIEMALLNLETNLHISDTATTV